MESLYREESKCDPYSSNIFSVSVRCLKGGFLCRKNDLARFTIEK